MSDKMIYPTIDNFEDEVMKSEIPVLVDFYADWCGPCQALAPILDLLSETYDGKVKFCKVNVDKAQQLAVSHKIMSIPTMLFVKNGAIQDRVVGGLPEQELTTKLEALLK